MYLKKNNDQTFSKFDEKYKSIYARNSMNFNQDKHKENHTKARHNQIAENQCEAKKKKPLNSGREKS